jgi:hypothetical protein
MATIAELQAQLDSLHKQLSDLQAENTQLRFHRPDLQRGFGFMAPVSTCKTCPAGIAQPAEGARQFGFMAPYPASPGTPTPSDVAYGFTNMGYPLAPQYPDYGHPRRIQRYGFMTHNYINSKFFS